MSNVKDVVITGRIPFDYLDYEPNDSDEEKKNKKEVKDHVVNFLRPSFGLRLNYGNRAELVPNDNSGQTAIYDFEIVGQEAIQFDWLKDLIKSLESVGATIGKAFARDIENNFDRVDLKNGK